MLDNRDYMRAEPESGDWFWQRYPAYLVTCVALAVIFFIDQFNAFYFPRVCAGYHQYLELTTDVFRRGYIWQLFTFQLFHGGLLHLLFNALVIYFLGRQVETQLGKKAFLKLYVWGGVAGGVLQAILMCISTKYFGTSTIGASAGCFSIFAAFAMMDPYAMLLLFFVIPVQARFLLYAETAYTLYSTCIPWDKSTAHGAHLGGLIFAWCYFHFDAKGWYYTLRNKLSPRKAQSRGVAVTASRTSSNTRRLTAKKPVDIASEEFISTEVDPILDKISAHGIQSLTEKEREILQAARKRMSKR